MQLYQVDGFVMSSIEKERERIFPHLPAMDVHMLYESDDEICMAWLYSTFELTNFRNKCSIFPILLLCKIVVVIEWLNGCCGKKGLEVCVSGERSRQLGIQS